MNERHVICSVDGCEKLREPYKPLCAMHRTRLTRWGTVGDNDPRALKYASPIERFVNRIEVSSDGCWLWQGSTYQDGYGAFSINGQPFRAHRWSYKHFVGRIPPTLHIDHLCSVKTCVNPDHLEPVTSAENTRRWMERKPGGSLPELPRVVK